MRFYPDVVWVRVKAQTTRLDFLEDIYLQDVSGVFDRSVVVLGPHNCLPLVAEHQLPIPLV